MEIENVVAWRQGYMGMWSLAHLTSNWHTTLCGMSISDNAVPAPKGITPCQECEHMAARIAKQATKRPKKQTPVKTTETERIIGLQDRMIANSTLLGAELLEACQDMFAFIEKGKANLIGDGGICTAVEYEALMKPIAATLTRITGRIEADDPANYRGYDQQSTDCLTEA